MKIGIYLMYEPHYSFSIKGEGLGRYLANLIQIMLKSGCKVCVACPTWVTGAVKELCDEYNFSSDDIEFVTPRSEPVLWRLLKWKHRARSTKKRTSFKDKIYQASYSMAERMVDLLVAVKSNLITVLLVIAAVLAGIVSVPLLILLAVLRLISLMIFGIFKLFKIDISSKVNLKRSIIDRVPGLKGFISMLRSNHIGTRVSEKLRMDSARSVLKRINAMKQPADVWYCPMAYWPEFAAVPGVGVTCFPDITPSWFSADFADLGVRPAVDNVRKTVDKCKYFITYSEYQKNSILSANLGVDKAHIVSIPLAVNDTFHDIDVRKSLGKFFPDACVNMYARSLLGKMLYEHALPEVKKYLYTKPNAFSFNDIKYVFYSSQCRPNKNILTLIKAYEYLLREKEATFKLVLTCYPAHVASVNQYIFEHRLQFDVLCFHMVSNQQLAALYACADLVVNSTIFEGGFPMTFAEGMAVGTPSVMGTIPQVTDVTDQFDMSDCLFDPFDYKDMAEKILYGVQNREKLYQKQLPLYNSLVTSTEEEYGKDYIDAFKYFIELDKAEKAEHTARNKFLDGVDSAD